MEKPQFDGPTLFIWAVIALAAIAALIKMIVYDRVFEMAL